MTTPLPDATNQAEALLSELLDQELIELTSAHDRQLVTSIVAEQLESGASAAELAAVLEDTPAVAELHASDEELEKILASLLF